jgi:pimeloyl-ACP methyl ester carboxylesterase
LIDPLNEAFETFINRSIAQPGTSHYAQVTGIRMHWLEWPGPAGAPTLLLLHGFLAHAHWWDFVAPWLAQRYRVIAPDFSGMGDSQYRAVYSHAQYNNEIAGIAEATGSAGGIAIGHSFGGRALLYACNEHRDLFARAIVVDSRLGSPEDPIRGFNEEWRPKKSYPDAESIARRFSLRPIEPAPLAAMRHMAQASIREEASGWVWKFDAEVTRLFQVADDAPGVDDIHALRDLTMPVDFIYGESSRVVTPPRAAQPRHAGGLHLWRIQPCGDTAACCAAAPLSAQCALGDRTA